MIGKPVNLLQGCRSAARTGQAMVTASPMDTPVRGQVALRLTAVFQNQGKARRVGIHPRAVILLTKKMNHQAVDFVDSQKLMEDYGCSIHDDEDARLDNDHPDARDDHQSMENCIGWTIQCILGNDFLQRRRHGDATLRSRRKPSTL